MTNKIGEINSQSVKSPKITFSSIYDLVIPLWGNEIDISDFIVEKVTTATKSAKPAYDWHTKFSKNLATEWHEVEKLIGTKNPHNALMVWTMYQVFLAAAEKLFLEEKFTLCTQEIDVKLIEAQYRKNLSAEGREEQLASYVNDTV